MFLVVEIPDIPIKEGMKALEYIRKKYKLKEEFLWKDGIAVSFNVDKVVVKGPKISINNEREITAFKNKLSYGSDYVMFYESNGYVYCDTYIRINPISVLKEIPWIRPIKIMGDLCTRPVRLVSISSYGGFNEEFIGCSYCGIFVEEKFYSSEDFLSFYEEKNVFIRNEKKMINISSTIGKFFSQSLLDTLIHIVENPVVVFLPLEDKYMSLPQRIVDYIISKELMVFPKYNFSILEGFYFITNNSCYDLDGLLLTMNSRLEDLLISYERDMKLIRFNESRGMGDKESMGMDSEQKSFAREKDFQSLAFYLMEGLELFDLKKNHVEFLVNNHKNDHKTTLVEEYPELLGILSYYAYETHKDYNPNVQDALLSYSGDIKNEYGLLLYITDKFYFLLELDKKKQLATSNKDPFGTKVMVDKIIELLLRYKKSIPISIFPTDLNDLFSRRIRMVLQNRYGDVCYKIKKLQDKGLIVTDSLLELEQLLEFTSKNYNQIKNIVGRIAFCKDLSLEESDRQNEYKVDFKQKSTLLVQMQFVENILNHNRAIINNARFLYILKEFYGKITSLIEF